MIAIFKKELLLFTKNKIGLITVSILLLVYSLILFTNIFNLNILENGYADFSTFFSISPIIYLWLELVPFSLRSKVEHF